MEPIKIVKQLFNNHVTNAILLFIFASFFSILFVFIADLTNANNGKWHKVWNNTWSKLSDAFTMIAAASLTGAAYIILGEIRHTCKPI